MKHLIVTLVVTISLAACSRPPTAAAPSTNDTTTAPIVTDTAPMVAATQTTADDVTEEAEIRGLVENFGKRLQAVSLLAPDAAQELQKQYSEFVSPSLLETWISDVTKAPGRMVSSPWPDRIEISNLATDETGKYVITGLVIEISSTEVVNSGAAAKIPVRIVIQKDLGRWLITDYKEEQ